MNYHKPDIQTSYFEALYSDCVSIYGLVYEHLHCAIVSVSALVSKKSK